MLDNLHKSIANVTNSPTIVACLELCGYETPDDYRSITPKTLNDIEKYISNITITMSKCERQKYMESAFVDSPHLFTISPVVKSRLLSFLHQIFAFGDFYTLINGATQSKSEIFHHSLSKVYKSHNETTENNMAYDSNYISKSIIEKKVDNSELFNNVSDIASIVDKDADVFINNLTTDTNNVKEKLNGRESLFENDNECNLNNEKNDNSKHLKEVEKSINTSSINDFMTKDVIFRRKSQRLKRFKSFNENKKSNTIGVVDKIVKSNSSWNSNDDKISETVLPKLQSNYSNIFLDTNNVDTVTNMNDLSSNNNLISIFSDTVNIFRESSNLKYVDNINESNKIQMIFDNSNLKPFDSLVHFNKEKEANITLGNEELHKNIHRKFLKHFKHSDIQINKDFNFYHYNNDKKWGFYLCKLCRNPGSEIKAKVTSYNNVVFFSILTHLKIHFPQNTSRLSTILAIAPQNEIIPVLIQENVIHEETKIKLESDIQNDDYLIEGTSQDNNKLNNDRENNNLTLTNKAIHKRIAIKVGQHFSKSNLQIDDDFNFYICNDDKRCGIYICKLCDNHEKITARVTINNKVIYTNILSHLKIHFTSKIDTIQNKRLKDKFLVKRLDFKSKQGLPISHKKDIVYEQTKVNILDWGSTLYIDKSNNECIQEYFNENIEQTPILSTKLTHRNIVRKVSKHYKSKTLQINKDFNFYYYDDNKKWAFFLCKLCLKNKKINCRVTSTNKIIFFNILTHLRIHFGHKMKTNLIGNSITETESKGNDEVIKIEPTENIKDNCLTKITKM